MAIAYETMYILRPDLTEEQVDQSISKYQDLLKENGAEILETQHRGKRRLAYEIQKLRDGIYIQMNYNGNGEGVKVMEKAMRISEEVIRYMTVKQELPSAPEEAEAAAEE
ncbi:MAG: 30S ribosomal protein S6 [Acaryochloridaceae cyanobacterium RL_2_7]|nr:30S ribosomal protein S6 [Acaryochloridaceae cyanobacterium RL_2_7]